ncbi:MAG: nucleoside hydrolase, partial [Bacteroidales bacterium]
KSIIISGFILLICSCSYTGERKDIPAIKQPIIFDTDANNELDDQHALAYLLLNGNTFKVSGITVNATYSGGDANQHYAEAERVVKLCGLHNKIPVFKGADGKFEDIKIQTDSAFFDGYQAVNFIIETAKKKRKEKLLIIAVGKLTNIALALKKEPSISGNVEIVWLGSNYPESGEYNQDNDTASMNFILNTDVPFQMVTVRYGKPSGTAAVTVTQNEINMNMPGKGPKISELVTGRHGGSFNCFGDYSVSLFKHIDYHGDPPSRSLFDMAAVAIVKNPEWAESTTIPCPRLVNNKWVEQPDNKRKIVIWENFDKEKIIADFYYSLDKYIPVKRY